MKLSAEQHRTFGQTGLRVPPIMFGTAALGDARRVIPDQTKREICGEWFRHVAPPVFIDTANGDGRILAMLARALDRLDVALDESTISTRLRCEDERTGYHDVLESWDEVCHLLGGQHAPKLVALDDPDAYLSAARSPAERNRRLQHVLDACHALGDLKDAGKVAGIGVAATDWHVVKEIAATAELDWVLFKGGFTVMRHPPELLHEMAGLVERQIAIVTSGVFHCDFLLGGSHFAGREIHPKDPRDQPHLSWRKAFVALCHAHGITPAHACIQFALSGPGVVAVALETSHPDRVAENVASVATEVPDALWTSMKEEGLLDEAYPS